MLSPHTEGAHEGVCTGLRRNSNKDLKHWPGAKN